MNEESYEMTLAVIEDAHPAELRTWVRPEFDRVALKDALNGNVGTNDNGNGSS
jgi:hypothetical protein